MRTMVSRMANLATHEGIRLPDAAVPLDHPMVRRVFDIHLGATPLQIVQLVAKLFRCEIDFTKNFTDQGRAKS